MKPGYTMMAALGLLTSAGGGAACAQILGADFDVRGAPYPLLPGMTGRAEIIVAEQSALAYVFEPIRALGQQVERGP